jgi:hypothetical protein
LKETNAVTIAAAPMEHRGLIKQALTQVRLQKDLRYLGVAAICAVVSNILLISIVNAGLGYLSATALTLFPMFFIGYGLHAGVTFKTKPSFIAFLRYCFTMLAAVPLWVAIIFVLYDVIKLPIVIASPVGTVIVFLWNYVSTHWALLQSVRGATHQENSGKSEIL